MPEALDFDQLVQATNEDGQAVEVWEAPTSSRHLTPATFAEIAGLFKGNTILCVEQTSRGIQVRVSGKERS
jgi:hypothetical protein